MKKLLFFLFILIFTLLGCEKTIETIEIEPPSNLKVEIYGPTGLSLKFSWGRSPTTDIDGYRLYLGTTAGDSLMWEGTDTNCVLSDPPIGEFTVTAYKGSKSESDPTNAVDTKPMEGNVSSIYYKADPDPNHPSAFYWDVSDTLVSHLVALSDTTERDLMDFYFDSDTSFTSMDVIISTYKTTYFKFMSVDTSVVPDIFGTLKTTGKINRDEIYFLKLKDGYYAKIKITKLDTTTTVSADFSYEFQKIKGYRRFK